VGAELIYAQGRTRYSILVSSLVSRTLIKCVSFSVNSLCYVQTRLWTILLLKSLTQICRGCVAFSAVRIGACYSLLKLCLACSVAYLKASKFFSLHVGMRYHCCCIRRMFTCVSFGAVMTHIHIPNVAETKRSHKHLSIPYNVYIPNVHLYRGGGEFSNRDCRYVIGFGERKHSE
jgi:hypothetical protein